MSADKHTPGPWEPPREPNGRGMGWQAGPCWLGGDAWSEETAANARLVSAAPKLLAALRRCAQRILIDEGVNSPIYQQAKAAIDEAEGKA